MRTTLAGLEINIMSLKNDRNVSLVEQHIKLRLKKGRKALNREGNVFIYLRRKFARIGEAKLLEGMFIEPLMRDLFKDDNFEATV